LNLTYEHIRDNSTLYTNIGLQKYSHLLVYNKWRFFYSLTGDGAPLDSTCRHNQNIPDYVELMLYKFETSKILLEKSFGLRDPLSGGFFYDKGAKFIDIYIDNIPREHGIASGIVYDEKFDILNDTPSQGKSLKITIHKNLIKKTATPIHELFHIFQYSYTHFNNMWYMEGLARWAQSIMQEKTGTHEPLPKNLEELETLVHKLHDAEFFFNNLITLCEIQDTFEVPPELENNSEIYNNKKTGSTFMKLFLENCEKQYQYMKQNLKQRELDDSDYVQRHEKRSTNNNQYIFKAIIDTVEKLVNTKNEELSNFIDLIYPLAHIESNNFNTQEIQSFLKVIKRANNDFVLESEDGILYSEFFDIFTGTFSSKALDFTESDICDDELESFKILKRVNGALIFKNSKNLTSLNGLRNLISIDGDLILTGTNLKKLNELNNLTSVNNLNIAFMDNLTSISGFNELTKIKTRLFIANNKKLTSIKGFNSLIDVANIEITKTELVDCNFLSVIFKTHTIFNGFIKIYNNKLENIHFMSGIQKITSSLFLHQNNLVNLEGLNQLTYIGGSLSLSTNKINSLMALSNLQKINGLLALSYNNLTSLNGLENLKSLETKKWGNIYFTLKIYGNKELKDISALSNIQTKDSYIVIYFDNNIEYLIKPDLDSNFHKNILELHDFQTNRLIPTYKFVNKKEHNYSNFRATTHNKLLTSLFDFEVEDAEVLILSFTGAYGNLGGLFYNKYPLITDNIQTHKIFIMDPTHTWYNKGFHPFTKNMDENVTFIKELITSKKYKKVVCMGASMGAYLSLILGCTLENFVDEVLAFSPQIFLDKTNREKIGDTRWATLIKNFPINMKDEYWNLKLLFQKYKNITTLFNIHYASKEPLDNEHIKYLDLQENINLIAYNVDDHYITIMLHKQNRLNPIILNSLKEK
jgi:hypothetical protein